MYVFHTYTAVYIENYLLFFKILFAYKKYECEFENSCELFSSNHSCEFESKTIALKNYFQANRHCTESENYWTIIFNNFHLKILNVYIYNFQEELSKVYCKYKTFAS